MKECEFYITDTTKNCKIMPNPYCEDVININCPYRERLAWETILKQVKHLDKESQKIILQTVVEQMNKMRYAIVNFIVENN